MLSNISNTRERVSFGYTNTEERYDAQRNIFDEIRGVLIVNETLSQVFDIKIIFSIETKTSQTKE